jgi:hypothetical protein
MENQPGGQDEKKQCQCVKDQKPSLATHRPFNEWKCKESKGTEKENMT